MGCGSLQQGKIPDGRIGAGEPVLACIAAVGACTLSQHNVPELHLGSDAAGGAYPDDFLYVVGVEQLIGVDADGGHAHAAALDGYGNALISARKAQHIPHPVVAHRMLQILFCDELRPQGISGHQHPGCDLSRICLIVGCRHVYSSFRAGAP